MPGLNLKLVACKVLQREAYLCAARSPNLVDVEIMPQGLHNTPDKLRQEVQKALDQTDDQRGRPYDAILLGYGLCSNGIDGLVARIPLVVPRAHDCITLLLGSLEKYKEYFDSHRGVYWYSPGWIEHGNQPGKKRYEQTLKEYRQKYGEENAQYLMELEHGWLKEYGWATYIDWGFGKADKYKKFTKECAEYLNWVYDELKGDRRLMQKLVDGDWDNELFLRVEAGRRIVVDLTDAGLVRSE
jgi:hypothetical protein